MDDGSNKFSSRKRKRQTSDCSCKLPVNVQKNIEELFQKNFTYTGNEKYSLPRDTNKKCLSESWEIDGLIAMKTELNTLKNELNDKNMLVWHEHTRLVNLSGNIGSEVRRVMRPELCTQAWCKFYEIASRYLQTDDRTSFFRVHLCEAPGAFITSLNHYLFSCGYLGEWNWVATTLNPYYEGNNTGQMIDEDRFIRCSYGNWYFGEDGTGNLMSDVNLTGLKDKLNNVKVDLVTADGSIDCQGDPAEQEKVVSRLQHTEVLTALHILSPGGMLVVKMFTMFECKAIGLMYLLNCVFEKVELFKPCTSKGGNSEVYVIGISYKGRESCENLLKIVTPVYFGVREPEGCLFTKDEIPETFLNQHYECMQHFKEWQMWTIQRNLDLHKDMTDKIRSKVEEEKDYCMDCFFNQYNIKSLPHHRRMMRLLKGQNRGGNRSTEFSVKTKLEGKFSGSFCERQELALLPWQQKIFKMETYEEEVNREDNSLWIQHPGGVMTEEEVLMFCTVQGKPLVSIQSSRFCHGVYLGQIHEVIRKSQWLPQYKTCQDSEFVKMIAQKLKKLILESIHYNRLGGDNLPEINTSETCDTQMVTAGATVCTTLNNDTGLSRKEFSEGLEEKNTNYIVSNVEQDVIVPLEGNLNKNEIKSANLNLYTPETNNVSPSGRKYSGEVTLSEINLDCDNMDTGAVTLEDEQPKGDNLHFSCKLIQGKSQILEEFLSQINENCSGNGEGMLLRLYSVSSGSGYERFELDEREQLLQVVLDILKSCRECDYVIIEMGTCLSRLTAGLVFILYRTFREIGFVHHHGNLLKRHLVCVDFQYCPIKLYQYVNEVSHMIESDQSAAVLEMIPVLSLMEDEKFKSFLTISNDNLLQSFITTVVNEEKQMYHHGNQN